MCKSIRLVWMCCILRTCVQAIVCGSFVIVTACCAILTLGRGETLVALWWTWHVIDAMRRFWGWLSLCSLLQKRSNMRGTCGRLCGGSVGSCYPRLICRLSSLKTSDRSVSGQSLSSSIFISKRIQLATLQLRMERAEHCICDEVQSFVYHFAAVKGSCAVAPSRLSPAAQLHSFLNRAFADTVDQSLLQRLPIPWNIVVWLL